MHDARRYEGDRMPPSGAQRAFHLVVWFLLPAVSAAAIASVGRRLSFQVGVLLGSISFLTLFFLIRPVLTTSNPLLDTSGLWRHAVVAVLLYVGLVLLAGDGLQPKWLLLSVLVAAAVEEYVFRLAIPSLMSGYLSSGAAKAVLVPLLSQGAFALAHFAVPGNAWGLGMRAALVLLAGGYLYLLLLRLTGSLPGVVAIHAFLNTKHLSGQTMGIPLTDLQLLLLLMGVGALLAIHILGSGDHTSEDDRDGAPRRTRGAGT